MNRLFTFGCSFTQYAWPTWANIIGKEFDYFENWGMAGGGNQFIFSSLNECINKNLVNKHDTVIVMWTDICRQDGYTQYNWHRNGNIFNNNQFSNLMELYDFRGRFIRDIMLIDSAKRILESIGCRYQFHSMVPLNTVNVLGQDSVSNIDDIIELYNSVLSIIKPSVYEKLANFDWRSLSDSVDYSYFQKYSINANIKKLEKRYYKLSGSGWPLTFDDYILTNKLTNKDIIDEINQYNFKSEFLKLTKTKIIAGQKDFHPSPVNHLRYVQQMFDEVSLSSSTIEWVHQIQHSIQNGELVEFNENLPDRI